MRKTSYNSRLGNIENRLGLHKKRGMLLVEYPYQNVNDWNVSLNGRKHKFSSQQALDNFIKKHTNEFNIKLSLPHKSEGL